MGRNNVRDLRLRSEPVHVLCTLNSLWVLTAASGKVCCLFLPSDLSLVLCVAHSSPESGAKAANKCNNLTAD